MFIPPRQSDPGAARSANDQPPIIAAAVSPRGLTAVTDGKELYASNCAPVSGGGMGDQEAISAKIEHARQVEKVLRRLGWLVAAVGAAGMAAFSAFWAAGDLNTEQGVSLVLGTTLATVLSGAAAYGAGVNIGLGAERLQLAATAAAISTLPQGQPTSDRMTARRTQ